MALFLDVLSWLLLTLGGLFVLVGGIGALRMPNFFTRVHAASVTDSMAAMLILFGAMLQAGLSIATIKLLAILFFLLMTSPTASYALASAAVLSGQVPATGPQGPGSIGSDGSAKASPPAS